ncbi:c-type cytochrome [Pedobacter endophyticus]|uniref:c-type cytochrome n=1 Tax=Pedobacter endophyticus TaxID=2789740 RepID=UPI001E352B2D|nr:c-type cytochrome [Pedobacter endophyticus]
MKRTSFLILGLVVIFMASFCTADSSKENENNATATSATVPATAETTKTATPAATQTAEQPSATKETETAPVKPTEAAPVEAESAKAAPVAPSASTTALQVTAGEKLINKSDCIGCHNKVNKIIGPAYMDIAKKYPATEKNINYLSDKIIKGGSGVWGTMPMTAHATLKKDDAKLMVKYILSLKKK